MRKNHLLTTLLFLLITSAFAQNNLKIGQWRSHLPYQFGRYITQSEEKVFFTTDWAVLSIDKEERSVEFLSKVEGLSEVSTSLVKYNNANEALIVTFTNSDFDLVKEDGTTTFPNIRTNGNFFNRKINDIYLVGNDLAYFSTGFGVVEFNIAEEVFGFTANLGIEVYSLALFDGHFYATTEEGIYRAPNNSSTNLIDTDNWTLLGIADGLPGAYVSDVLLDYEGKLYVDINDTLFTYDGSQLTKIHHDPNFEIRFMNAEGARLQVGFFCVPDCGGKILSFDSSGNFERSGTSCVNRPLYVLEDQFGQVWYADQWRDIRVAESRTGTCQKIKFNTPFNELASDLMIDDNKLYVATEPTRNVPAFNNSGFYSLEEGQWSTFSKRTFTELKNSLAFYRIAVHPANKKVYVGTFWDGLIEYESDGENQTFQLYNDENSSLQTSALDTNVVRVGGLAFDSNNNLWMSNHTALNPISVLMNDGTWKNDFRRATPVLGLRQLVIDGQGNKWFSIDGDGQGLLVYNEMEMDDPNDDQSRIITVSNSELPSNLVNCLAVDLDGDVWVGTAQGAIVFECGTNLFEGTCSGVKPIVEVGGFNAYLLEDENVLAIGIDGADRKWFGTESGVFVQSSGGEEQVAFFNEDNSPLFDNIVSSIAINPIDGEVFMGTAKGLISYRSDAIEGKVVNSSDAYAFPNPVRSDYTGPIAIRGLARNADVKITDVSGQLVYETQALGGQAIWDGRDYNGRKASSGVYLVFSTSTLNRENPDAVVTKILLMN